MYYRNIIKYKKAIYSGNNTPMSNVNCFVGRKRCTNTIIHIIMYNIILYSIYSLIDAAAVAGSRGTQSVLRKRVRAAGPCVWIMIKINNNNKIQYYIRTKPRSKPQ